MAKRKPEYSYLELANYFLNRRQRKLTISGHVSSTSPTDMD
jgi:hypothetical protein